MVPTDHDQVRGDILDAKTITPAQCRMARAAVQWSVDEAAAAAGVSYRTIVRLENDQREIQLKKVTVIRHAFEAAGVRFIDSGVDAGGVVPPSLKVPLSRSPGRP